MELQHFYAPQMVESSGLDETGQAVAAAGALPSRLSDFAIPTLSIVG